MAEDAFSEPGSNAKMSARWARDTPVSEHRGRLGRESFCERTGLTVPSENPNP
jgi:hypothetical protein